MNKHDTHINLDSYLKEAEIPMLKSKDEMWERFSEKISEQPVTGPKGSLLKMALIKVAAAAIIIALVTSSFLRFYTIAITAEKGNHLNHVLPDGSLVELNAQSRISYHPYWWRFSRAVSLLGEAYFDVEKGKKFMVVSEYGKTLVLGTSFNVFARSNDYKVFCETGIVKVSSTKSNVELILKPGEMATLDNINNLGKIESYDADKILGWKNNQFSFNSEPLPGVFKELERQYNVSILLEMDKPAGFVYTGYFPKPESVNITLDLICNSFDFTFVKLGKDQYKVSQNR